MIPLQIDRPLKACRGDDYQVNLHAWIDQFVTPKNLTVFGTAWLAQLRTAPDDTVPAVAFTVDSSSAATGLIRLKLSGAQTAALVPGDYGFDVQVTSSTGVVRTLWTGRLTVTGDFTR